MKKFEELLAKTTQLELKSDNHEVRLNDLDDLVSDLKIDLNNLKARIDQLNSTDQAIETSIETIIENFNQFAVDLDAVAEKSNQGDEFLGNLIRNQESHFALLEDDLKGVFDHVNSTNNNLQAEVDNLQIKTDDLQKELNRVHENSDQENTELRSEIQNVKNDLNRVEQNSDQEDTKLRSEIQDVKNGLKRLSEDYCIVLTPHSNPGDKISILKNNQVVDKTPHESDFNQAHRYCFDSFLPSDDIIELRHGGTNGVRISLGLIYGGISTQLFFGPNADLSSVAIDEDDNKCSETNEVTSKIRIQDGKIIESECLGNFTLTPKSQTLKYENCVFI